MKQAIKKAWTITFILFILFSIVTLFSMISYDVDAADNDTLVVEVNVTNSEPTLYNVFVNPTSVALEAGNITTVNCTGEVHDINGWDDIASVNASIYDTTYGYSNNPSTEDFNYRYFNQSCNCTSIDTTNASCSCLFSVQYYTNNGTWQCNMTVADTAGLSSNRNSSIFNVETLTAIDVPSILDFGDMSVGEESAFVPLNISNYGNVKINVSVRGWGGTQDYSAAVDDIGLICETGNISTSLERYSINNSETYEYMTNLTNTSTGIPNFNLQVRTNDITYGNDTNLTYWKLQIPNNIAGYCNGTIEFKAAEI